MAPQSRQDDDQGFLADILRHGKIARQFDGNLGDSLSQPAREVAFGLPVARTNTVRELRETSLTVLHPQIVAHRVVDVKLSLTWVVWFGSLTPVPNTTNKNRAMRVTRIVLHRIGIALICVPLLAARADSGNPRPAMGCEHPGTRVLVADSFSLAGMALVSRRLQIPAGEVTMISIIERGIDLRVEAIATPGDVHMADSPIRRWGPQRIVLDPGPARVVDVTVVGKERVTGSATLWHFALGQSSRSTPCLEALRQLALGDQRYDRGQAVTLARADAGTEPAKVAYAGATQAYGEAARRLDSLPTSLARAQAELSRAATFYQALENYSDTVGPALAAVSGFTLAQDAYGRDRARAVAASANMELALAQNRLRNTDPAAGWRAREMLTATRAELLDIVASHSARGDSYDEALALNNAGLTYIYVWEFARAIPYFERAFAIHDRLGEMTRKGQVMQNLALAQDGLGRFSQSRKTYLQVLDWLDASENPKLYADTLNNLALSEYRLGHVDEALRQYSKALEIHTRIQVPREQARSLHGIGATYYAVGKNAEARSYFERALALRQPDLDPVGRIVTLRAVADIERDAGSAALAVSLRGQALSLTQNAPLRARIQIELARDFAEADQLDRAETELTRVFAADLRRDHVTRARALLERARLSFARREFASAEQDALASFNGFRELELAADAFRAQNMQARSACAMKDSTLANRLARDTMSRSETLRLSSRNPYFRLSVSRSLRPTYDLGIQLAVTPAECGGTGAANASQGLAVSEMSRGRALDDFRRIAIDPETAANGSGERDRRELLRQLAEKRASLEYLAERAEGAEAPMAALSAEIKGLERQLDIAGARAAQTPTDRKDVEANLRRAAERIPPDTAVIEYWLGETGSYAWILTSGQMRMVELGDTVSIDSAAREFHAALRDFTRIPVAARVQRSRALFARVLAPLIDDIEGKRRVYFVPDGMLHGIPFAALVTNTSGPPQYLVSNHDVAISASIQSIPVDAGSVHLAAGARVLIVADPVYARDDARLAGAAIRAQRPARHAPQMPTLRGPSDTNANGGWSRLVGSGKEASAIAASMPMASVEVITGFDANRDAMLRRELKQFDVLHFATHAVADLEAPQLSTLVLSLLDEKGNPLVGDVFAGDLLSRPLDADLVVFSGCETAIGQATAGEGLFSLRYAAHAAGGRTVVASLWPVTDVAGAALMAEFYAALSREKLTPEAALARAMRQVMRRWPDPALWSVFEVSRVAAAQTVH